MRLEDVIRHELIGREAEIVESRVKSQKGMKGRIIDETRNTLVLETERGDKRVLKKDIIIKVKFGRKNVMIEGSLLVARPEDRIKKKLRW